MILISWIFFAAGLIIMAFGALGMIILPTLFQRFHASTKCGVSGAFSLIIGLALRMPQIDFLLKFLVIILFIIITTPLIAHMLAVSSLEGDTDDGEGREEP